MLVRATHCKTFYLINKPVCRIQLFKMSIMLWCNTFCHLKPFCTDLLLRLIFYVAKVQLGRSQLISGWSGGWMVQVVVPLKWCFSRLCLSPHLTIPCTECKINYTTPLCIQYSNMMYSQSSHINGCSYLYDNIV